MGGVASEGLSHALVWPVDVSGVLLPWPPLNKMLDPNATDDTTLALQATARDALGFGTTDEMYDWLGLARFDGSVEAMPGVAWPSSMRSGDAMGAGIVQTQWGEALTFSCAACHTANMFGKTVVGLTNRRAQANAFFHLAGTFFPDLSSRIFQSLTGANADEVTLYKRAQKNFGAVGSKLPQAMGLDTSLAQVSLSLSKRAQDPWATQDPAFQDAPRPNDLDTLVADSKPAVWWTLKYKTRWLSDGSIVSGNPVHTNFLWNELGRGTDLQELSAWLQDNQAAVDALTVAVFATPSPRWTDFFGAESIDIDTAKRGQTHYQNLCSTCHGTYDKAWDLPNADTLTPAQRLDTVRLNYHSQTPVLNVGTDPQRAAGMASFASRLNELAISQELNTVVEVQTGYVPPTRRNLGPLSLPPQPKRPNPLRLALPHLLPHPRILDGPRPKRRHRLRRHLRRPPHRRCRTRRLERKSPQPLRYVLARSVQCGPRRLAHPPRRFPSPLRLRTRRPHHIPQDALRTKPL